MKDFFNRKTVAMDIEPTKRAKKVRQFVKKISKVCKEGKHCKCFSLNCNCKCEHGLASLNSKTSK